MVRVREFVLYGVQFSDGDEVERIRWSLYEDPYELDALWRLATKARVAIYAFTEAGVNVAFGVGEAKASPPELSGIMKGAIAYPFRRDGVEQGVSEEADKLLQDLNDGSLSAETGCFIEISPPAEWAEVMNHFISNDASRGLVSLFDKDEGGQQEGLAHWLLDSLEPDGISRSPEVHEQGNVRELTDVLLTYPKGPFLIESKALSILARPDLPQRSKLARQVVGHVKKAARQLLGANKAIRKGLVITDSKGTLIEVERTQPAHLIILIPDLTLLADSDEDFMPLYIDVMEASGGFLHILDPTELLRVVQAARAIVAAGKAVTPMMALDFYLIKRTEHLIEAGHPSFDVLLRIE